MYIPGPGIIINLCISFQEEQNRGKPNWEHLNDELHVLITVEDTENRAKLKIERAVDEVKKLLTVVSVVKIFLKYFHVHDSHTMCNTTGYNQPFYWVIYG